MCWWGHASQTASVPQLPTMPTTPDSPVEAVRVVDDRVFADQWKRTPYHWTKEEEGRTVNHTDAWDGVSIKTPRGRQRETTPLSTLPKNNWIGHILRGQHLLREVIEQGFPNFSGSRPTCIYCGIHPRPTEWNWISCIKICFENRHGNMLTYKHCLKFWKLMLLLSCLWHAFLEFLLL